MDDSFDKNLRMTGSAMIGGSAFLLGKTYITKAANMLLSDKIKIEMTPFDIEPLKQAGKDAFHAEQLETSGVKMIDASTQEGIDFVKKTEELDIQTIDDKINRTKFPVTKFFRKLAKNKKVKTIKEFYNDVLNGQNAYYSMNSHKGRVVVVNMEKAPCFLPHELGHALNHRAIGPKLETLLYKYLRRDKYIQKAVGAILLVSLLTNKRTEEEHKKLTSKRKIFADWVKNNCGKLAFLGCLPKLAEETIASIRGEYLARKYIPKDSMRKNHLKPVTKSHLFSFSGYAQSAIIIGLCAYLANLARDKYMESIPQIRSKIWGQNFDTQRAKPKSDNTQNYFANKIKMDSFLKG